ncbi:MAG TPA: formylmethanofuran dehydrogenase subunit B, partial [Candidatus Methanoperedenaceae archaeon]|nr:formylmethanofuran dehydrogenase subunit B [Candidatus Methanoperedenaceae archaeon]
MLIEDVLCPFCGCLCDDLAVNVENNKIVEVKRACKLGNAKIMGHHRIKSPMIRKDGNLREASYDEAIERAAQILSASKRPLLYGWASSACEVHKKGILLAETTGGIIDNTASVCHGPSALAVHEKGLPSASLGQVKNRADIIVFWGCNPVHAHPRHMGRYSVFTRGLFSEKGRKARKVVVVDVRKTETAAMADEYIEVKQGNDYSVISALRAILAGQADVVPDSVGGVPKEKLVALVNTLKAGKFVSVFFGMGLTQSRGRYKNIDNAISLVTELNAFTKCVITPMRGHYNVTGFGQVCAWESGYVTAVDFSRGAPYYNPGETASNDLLGREEVDASLVIAGDAGAHFPARSVKALARVPVIQIDPYWNATTEIAEVVIPTAVYGVEAEGTAYRMDGVSLRLRKLINPSNPTDEEVIDKLIKRV